jgi:hypothetical protein
MKQKMLKAISALLSVRMIQVGISPTSTLLAPAPLASANNPVRIHALQVRSAASAVRLEASSVRRSALSSMRTELSLSLAVLANQDDEPPSNCGSRRSSHDKR